MSIPKLTTSRLQLRQFVLSDAKSIQFLLKNRNVVKTTATIPHPYPNGLAKKWILNLNKSIKNKLEFTWAITLSETKELIGAISLLNYNSRNKHAEIGYWIGFPFWNKGYCTEAAEEILKYGFKKIKLNRIFGCHFPHNPASRKVLKKLGMKKEGIFRKHIKRWGKFYDAEYHGILKQEWKKLNQKSV
jgi:RimJ/RimL family protein N-acetyltransferase